VGTETSGRTCALLPYSQLSFLVRVSMSFLGLGCWSSYRCRLLNTFRRMSCHSTIYKETTHLCLTFVNEITILSPCLYPLVAVTTTWSRLSTKHFQVFQVIASTQRNLQRKLIWLCGLHCFVHDVWVSFLCPGVYSGRYLLVGVLLIIQVGTSSKRCSCRSVPGSSEFSSSVRRTLSEAQRDSDRCICLDETSHLYSGTRASFFCNIITLTKGEGIAFGSVCLFVCLSAQNFRVFLRNRLLYWDNFHHWCDH